MNNKRNPVGIIKKVFINKIVIEIFDLSKLNQNYKGNIYKCTGIGNFLCIYKSIFEISVFQVTGLYEEEKNFTDGVESKFHNKAYFEAVPIGDICEKKFQFGMSSYPMIGDEVFLTLDDEFEMIFNSNFKEGLIFKIGELNNNKGYFPNISMDKLFSTHVSVLGNTGSGKSTTIRRMLIELGNFIEEDIIDEKEVNIYIFDIHNEYNDINEIKSTIYSSYSIDDISIPLEKLCRDDWLNLLTPSLSSQLPILINAIKLGSILEKDSESINWIKVFCAYNLYLSQQTESVAKRTKILGLLKEINDVEISKCLKEYNSQYANFTGSNETKFLESLREYIGTYIPEQDPKEYLDSILEDTELSIKSIDTLRSSIDLTLLLEESEGNSQIRGYCSTLITRIDNLKMLYGKTLFSQEEDRLKIYYELIDHNITPYSIIDVSNFEKEDLLFFSSFLLNQVYIKQKESRSKEIDRICHFIFDEAHTYITEDNEAVYKPLRMFEKIAKEGRKFGIFMLFSSQRPSELSKTVLSQCNNYILHRIRNNLDLEQIRKSIPYVSEDQLTRLSFLRTGSALMVGEAFPIPLEMKIKGEGSFSPSKTMSPSKVWKKQESCCDDI